MFTGHHQTYYWIEQPDGHFSNLATEFPELFLGCYLINTCIDSGPFKLSGAELDRGWQKHGNLSISPRITNVTEIPHDQFDEWYVFQTLPAITVFNRTQVFVNYGGFSLNSPIVNDLQQKFWHQLEGIMPEAYVAEGDNLLFVTKNLEMFNKVERWMSAR